MHACTCNERSLSLYSKALQALQARGLARRCGIVHLSDQLPRGKRRFGTRTQSALTAEPVQLPYLAINIVGEWKDGANCGHWVEIKLGFNCFNAPDKTDNAPCQGGCACLCPCRPTSPFAYSVLCLSLRTFECALVHCMCASCCVQAVAPGQSLHCQVEVRAVTCVQRGAWTS